MDTTAADALAGLAGELPLRRAVRVPEYRPIVRAAWWLRAFGVLLHLSAAVFFLVAVVCSLDLVTFKGESSPGFYNFTPGPAFAFVGAVVGFLSALLLGA